MADAARDRGYHIVTPHTEHRAILDPCARLEQQGMRVSYLPVRGDGVLDPAEVKAATSPTTVFVTVMMANNEIGVVQPIADLARLARARGAPLHTDAAQAAGHVPVDVEANSFDLLSLTAHKLYGPEGVGALFIRRGVAATPLVDGGGHEGGLRSGTLNVPAIVGFGRAASICADEMPGEAARLSRLRDRLWEGLRRSLTGVTVNGSMRARLPHNLNISVEGLSGEQLLMGLDDLAVSSGAACTSSSREPSRVLRALGPSDERALGSIRFGPGRFNTEVEVDYVIEKLCSLDTRLRAPTQVFNFAEDDRDLPRRLGGHLKTGHRSTLQNRPRRPWRARRELVDRLVRPVRGLLFQDTKPRLWECGNLALCARFPSPCGNRSVVSMGTSFPQSPSRRSRTGAPPGGARLVATAR